MVVHVSIEWLVVLIVLAVMGTIELVLRALSVSVSALGQHLGEGAKSVEHLADGWHKFQEAFRKFRQRP